jgi:twinkle protein
MIDWKDIELSHKKPNSKGETKTLCPKCSHTRKKKKDPCLSVNIDTGVAYCWNCGETSVREKKSQKVTYDLPPQQWENFTNLSDNVVKWFNSRGISQKTLIDCRITEEEYYQPQIQKKVNNIVFNYFYGVTLLNKKFRSSGKAFTQCKNAKKVFYGINDLEGEKECYIVEGEMDKLSLWEVGIKNCISVPNGANDLNDVFDTCGEELKQIEKFYIAVDNDEAGIKLEHALLNRLGKYKCSRIEFVNGKDANDELKHSVFSLEDALKNPIDYPVEGTFTAEDVWDDILDLYNNGDEETLKPKSESFSKFNDMFSILMGQLTVVTGVPSSGKSNFIEWYVLNLIKDFDNLKASYYSPEHFPLKKHHEIMSEKVVGKPFQKNQYEERMNLSELEKYKEWSKDKIYLTMPDGGKTPNWKWIMERWEEQCFRYGCNIFVVDAFNKVKMDNRESTAQISDVLADITMFCQKYNVHVFLIAHPRKMGKDEDGNEQMPDLYDVKGSGDFRDQTHNGLVVHRMYNTDDKRDVKIGNLKAKFKNQGSGNIGETITLKYNVKNGRYFEGYEDNFPLWDKPTQQTLTPIKSDIEPSRISAMNRQSGYNTEPNDNGLPMPDSFYDDVPF